MSFSSTVFVFIFLPAALVLFNLSKDEYRKHVLLGLSALFYFYAVRKKSVILAVSIIANYLFGLAVQNLKRKKLWFVLGICFNVSLLYVFKYLNYSLSALELISGRSFPEFELILPLGISFFTFQGIAYLSDIYRGKIEAERDFVSFSLLLVSFFKLAQGPLVDSKTFLLGPSGNDVKAGVKRFLEGFLKKVLIADNLAKVTSYYFGVSPGDLSVAGSWIGAVSFMLQIYYDFSGYTDMAIGVAKMFGYSLPENFERPYSATSIQDFWRRWHITLSRWFRDYVYIPLGGSRCTAIRHIFNLGVVWFLTGLWHGAGNHYILWGFMYFTALVVEKYIIKPQQKGRLFSIVYRILSLIYIMLCWIAFRAGGVRSAAKHILSLAGLYDNKLFGLADYRYLRNYWVFVLAGIIGCTPLVSTLKRKACSVLGGKEEYLEAFVLLGMFVLALSFIMVNGHNPFLYFDF